MSLLLVYCVLVVSALAVYSLLFMRWAIAISPPNYPLLVCHIANEAAQLTQLGRYAMASVHILTHTHRPHTSSLCAHCVALLGCGAMGCVVRRSRACLSSHRTCHSTDRTTLAMHLTVVSEWDREERTSGQYVQSLRARPCDSSI